MNSQAIAQNLLQPLLFHQSNQQPGDVPETVLHRPLFVHPLLYFSLGHIFGSLGDEIGDGLAVYGEQEHREIFIAKFEDRISWISIANESGIFGKVFTDIFHAIFGVELVMPIQVTLQVPNLLERNEVILLDFSYRSVFFHLGCVHDDNNGLLITKTVYLSME